MVSAEDVTMAYRLILGREPENPDIVTEYARSAPNLLSLREFFINSQEFSSSRVVHLPPFLDRGEAMRIDVDIDPGLMQEMLDNVARTWQGLGSTQPYWSVLSSDDYTMDKFGVNEEAYWRSGKSDVERLNAWLSRNGIEAFGAGHSCCEYGCGTGRVTRWLAEQFSRVIAIDISKPHIELAESHLKRAGISNVSFRHLDSLICLDQIGDVDVVFSFIVLQHNPPPIIALILKKMLSWLRPGGIAFFQVPTYCVGYEFIAANYLNQPSNMHVLPQKYVHAIAGQGNCEIIEVQPDTHVGSPRWISDTFLLRKRNYELGVEPEHRDR